MFIPQESLVPCAMASFYIIQSGENAKVETTFVPSLELEGSYEIAVDHKRRNDPKRAKRAKPTQTEPKRAKLTQTQPNPAKPTQNYPKFQN